MSKNKLVWIIQGFEEKFADGTLRDVVGFELFAETAEKAIERAKKLIKKKEYRIERVIEKSE